MFTERLNEISTRYSCARPSPQTVLMGKIKKLLRRAGLVRMNKVEPGLGNILHRLFKIVSVCGMGANTINPYRKERFAADERHAVITQCHRRCGFCLIPEIEHLFCSDCRTFLGINKRHLRLVKSFFPFLHRTVRQYVAFTFELLCDILAVEGYLEG